MALEFSNALHQAALAADRFEQMETSRDLRYDRVGFIMDMLAADGCNGNQPLKWAELLAADDSNFAHDAAGIYRHLDRTTGQLTDHFTPRFAA